MPWKRRAREGRSLKPRPCPCWPSRGRRERSSRGDFTQFFARRRPPRSLAQRAPVSSVTILAWIGKLGSSVREKCHRTRTQLVDQEKTLLLPELIDLADRTIQNRAFAWEPPACKPGGGWSRAASAIPSNGSRHGWLTATKPPGGPFFLTPRRTFRSC